MTSAHFLSQEQFDFSISIICCSNIFQIPNFLHLTPAAIKKHCEALKRMLTEQLKIQVLFILWYVYLPSLSYIQNHFFTTAFCTEWPSALDTDANCDKHFPIKVESTDYVSAGPSLRNPSARIVHLKVSISTFHFCVVVTCFYTCRAYRPICWAEQAGMGNEIRDLQWCIITSWHHVTVTFSI